MKQFLIEIVDPRKEEVMDHIDVKLIWDSLWEVFKAKGFCWKEISKGDEFINGPDLRVSEMTDKNFQYELVRKQNETRNENE